MTTSNRVLSISLIGTGSVASTMIPIHEVAQTSLLLHASRVIIIHSHSSGSLTFSYADKQITKRIKKGLKLLGIELLDHLILTTESYASMADEGLL